MKRNWKIRRTIDVDRLGSFEDYKTKWFTHRICLDIWMVAGISPMEILGRSGARFVTRARSIVCWLLREHFDCTFMSIARVMGRDHSTIVYSCRRTSRALEKPGSWERFVMGDICQQTWRDPWG